MSPIFLGSLLTLIVNELFVCPKANPVAAWFISKASKVTFMHVQTVPIEPKAHRKAGATLIIYNAHPTNYFFSFACFQPYLQINGFYLAQTAQSLKSWLFLT